MLGVVTFGLPSKPKIFFIHGWPDSGDVFREQVNFLQNQYHCVVITLPNHGGSIRSYKGADFPTIVQEVYEIIRTFRSQTTQPSFLIGHDWGAYIAYLLDQREPNLLSGLITLDVGGHLKPISIGHGIFIIGYQWWLLAAYVIGAVVPIVGDLMTRMFATIAQAPNRKNVSSAQNYFYYYFWRAIFCSIHSNRPLNNYVPSCPILYLYGRDKRYHFHSENWLESLKRNGGTCEAIEGDHWFLTSNPKPTNSAIARFLSRIASASKLTTTE